MRFKVDIDVTDPEPIIFTKLIEADTIWDAIEQFVNEVRKQEVMYKIRPEYLSINACEIIEKLVNRKLFNRSQL